MSLLLWRDAWYRDKRALQRFKCTDEDLRMEASLTGLTAVHPRMWEYKVQDAIQQLNVPLGKTWKVRVGLDGDGIGGVMVSQELIKGEHYDLTYGAVACQWRGTGVADEMFADTLEEIGRRCVEVGADGDFRVSGIIHKSNHASKAMCARAGLKHEEDLDEDDAFEVWARYLPLPEVPLFVDA